MENSLSETPWVSILLPLFHASHEHKDILLLSLEPNGFVVRDVALLPPSERFCLFHFCISENFRSHWKEL